jgi:hypothetical protein
MFDAAGIKLMPCAQRGNAGIPITTVNQHFVCSYVGMAIKNPKALFHPARARGGVWLAASSSDLTALM